MITGYKPHTKHVLESLFGVCYHEVVGEGSSPPFCSKCNSHITENAIQNMVALDHSLLAPEIGIGGGMYVAKLVNFLTKYGKLYFEHTKGIKWYSLCYVINNVDIGENTITYKSKSTQAFGFSVCWFSEILFRQLEDASFSKEEIRRIINDN